MGENNEKKKSGKVRSFFKGLVDQLDKKMAEKAKSGPCCCKSSGKDKNSCCG